MSSYMGRTQAQQVAWAANFLAVGSENPQAANLTEAQLEAFGELVTTMQACWTKIQEPTTRTKVTVAEFHSALKAMREMAQTLVAYVQASPDVTVAKKVALKITVRDKIRTSKPRPSTSPYIKVLGVKGRTVNIQLQQEESVRGKPGNGVTGAIIFTHLGPTAPSTLEQWMFSATVTRTRVKLPLPPSATGDTVWITGFWTNSKGESGPAATAISVNLPAGGVLPQEQEEAA